MTKPKIINFFAGPGAGKTTLASRLFSELKFRGHTPEYSYEWVKGPAYEGRIDFLTHNQLYILSKQLYSFNRVANQVEWIVTDSPILLSIVYAKNQPDYLPGHFRDLVFEIHETFDNLNLFVKRTKQYVPIGRGQSEEEAIEKDDEVKQMLDENKIPYTEVECDRWHAERIIPDYIMRDKGWIVRPLKG